PVPGAGRRRPPVPAVLLRLEAVLPVRPPLRRPLPRLRAAGRRPGRPAGGVVPRAGRARQRPGGAAEVSRRPPAREVAGVRRRRLVPRARGGLRNRPGGVLRRRAGRAGPARPPAGRGRVRPLRQPHPGVAAVMTLLLVSDIFPPRTGGSGRWFWEIYRRLPRQQVVVAAGEHPRQEEFDRTHDLRVARLPLTLREWGLLSREGLRDYATAVGRLRCLV